MIRPRHLLAALTLSAALISPASGEASLLGPDWTPPVFGPADGVPASAESAAARALRDGKQAPEASFKNADGETVNLEKLLADGPVVLIYYRGGWCPYCVKQLKAFEKRRGDIERAGGRVFAVSTELPEFVGKTREKNRLGFDVLSDPNAVASRAFGIAWANARYGPGLAKYNGNEKGEIPLGVTYVIDSDATIRWAYLEHDYKKRATPDQAIAALDAIE